MTARRAVLKSLKLRFPLMFLVPSRKLRRYRATTNGATPPRCPSTHLPPRLSFGWPSNAASACPFGTVILHAACDRWGDHSLLCCGGGDRVLRHNAIRSAVAEFTSASPELEKPGLLLSSRPPDPGGTGSELDHGFDLLPSVRPADVWVPRGVSGMAQVRPSHISSARVKELKELKVEWVRNPKRSTST